MPGYRRMNRMIAEEAGGVDCFEPDPGDPILSGYKCRASALVKGFIALQLELMNIGLGRPYWSNVLSS